MAEDSLNYFEDNLDVGMEALDIDAGLQHPVDQALLQLVAVQVEKVGGRQRQITAQIRIPCPVQHVWQILTDYDSLASFIPNLAKSRRLEHPAGGIRLEQVGTQRLLNFNFCARVVLDMEEHFPHELRFHMVEGDFKGFSGSWQLKPTAVEGHTETDLSYTVTILPRLTMPIAVVERRLSQDLSLNLVAVRQRALELLS